MVACTVLDELKRRDRTVIKRGAIGAIVDDTCMSLTDALPQSFRSICALFVTDISGASVILDTAALILSCVAHGIFPNSAFVVRHGCGVEKSKCQCGLYCEVEGVDLSSPENQERVELLLKAASLEFEGTTPIEAVHLEKEVLRGILTTQNCRMSAALLDSTLRQQSFSCHRYRGFVALRHGPRCPVASMCGAAQCRVLQVHKGVFVRLESQPHARNFPQLFDALERPSYPFEHDINCIGAVNRAIAKNPKRVVVNAQECFRFDVLDCARQLLLEKPNLKVVLVGGPSASGKTIFAADLCQALRSFGFTPLAVSIDDYYRGAASPNYPRLPNGFPDHECIEALNLPLLNEHMTRLIGGAADIEIPIFDMVKSEPKPQGRRVTLPSNGVLVLEGLFALDPKLSSAVPDDQKSRVFVLPMMKTNLSELCFVSNQTLRTLRRVARDNKERGRSASEILSRVESVRSGEERNLFPHMHLAEYVFNASLQHELSALHSSCVPLLETVGPHDAQYNEARSLIEALQYAAPLPNELVSFKSHVSPSQVPPKVASPSILPSPRL